MFIILRRRCHNTNDAIKDYILVILNSFSILHKRRDYVQLFFFHIFILIRKFYI